MPQIIEKTHYVSRQTNKFLFWDQVRDEPIYQRISFERVTRFVVTHVTDYSTDDQPGPRAYFGYQVDRQGRQCLGFKGNERLICFQSELDRGTFCKLIETTNLVPRR